MAHIESSSELSSSDDEASSDLQLQTGSKRAGQVPGPKAAAKRAKKQQIFVDSWLQHSAFKRAKLQPASLVLWMIFGKGLAAIIMIGQNRWKLRYVLS